MLGIAHPTAAYSNADVLSWLPLQCKEATVPMVPETFLMIRKTEWGAIHSLLTASIGCCVSKLCTVDVSPVLCLHYYQPIVQCVFRIVSTLLPAQFVMGVSPVLYLHYCQCSSMSVLVLYFTHVCLHYCQRNVLSIWVQYCVCTTASAVCCVCKPCIVFALMPAQCAVCVSPILCLHHCQHRILCV